MLPDVEGDSSQLKVVPPFRFATVCCGIQPVWSQTAESGDEKGNQTVNTGARLAVPQQAAQDSEYRADESTIYRGAYPSLRNFLFLRTLELSTIVSFVKGGPKGITRDLEEFCRHEHVRHVIVDLGGEKLPSTGSIAKVLSLLTDRRMLPAYIHCTDGGVSSGMCIMCLRMLENWSLESAANEFSRYVKDGSISAAERNYVTSFPIDQVSLPDEPEHLAAWLWSGNGGPITASAIGNRRNV